MQFKEKFKEWLVNDAAPTYGLIIIGIGILAFIGTPEIGMAIWQSLVGTDYVATSFAFIFTSHYTFGDRININGTKKSVWCLIFCLCFFICMKMVPINLPDLYTGVSGIKLQRFHYVYPVFSLLSIWFTILTLKSLKFSKPSSNENENSSVENAIFQQG